jgi:hypothetical protein
MTNCTVYGNNATQGAGLYNTASASATLTRVTVTANIGVGLSSMVPSGCGIDSVSQGSVLLHNFIVAGNFFIPSGGGHTASYIAGTVLSTSSYNLIGTGGSGGLVNGVNHNLVNVADPGLGTFGFNGGPTETVQLRAGSPAVGAGDPSLLGTTDQRGLERLGHVSIGAYQA